MQIFFEVNNINGDCPTECPRDNRVGVGSVYCHKCIYNDGYIHNHKLICMFNIKGKEDYE